MIYLVFNLLSEYKAFDINVFDGKFLLMDYVVVSSGTSNKHIRHVAINFSNYFKKFYSRKIKTSGINSDWVVLEIEDIVVHLMLLQSRHFYSLDFFYKENSSIIAMF